jgi:hypothetical protein
MPESGHLDLCEHVLMLGSAADSLNVCRFLSCSASGLPPSLSSSPTPTSRPGLGVGLLVSFLWNRNELRARVGRKRSTPPALRAVSAITAALVEQTAAGRSR